jgi:acyl-CoA dehydrogenase
LLWLLLFLTTSLALAWHRAGLRMTTAAYAALLLAYGVFGGSLALFGLGLLIFLGAFVPLSLPTLREEWLTRPLLDHFQRRLLSLRSGLDQSVSHDAAADRLIFDEGATTLPMSASVEPIALASELSSAPRITAEFGGNDVDARGFRKLLRQFAASNEGQARAQQLVQSNVAAQLVMQHGSARQRSDLLPQIASGQLKLQLATTSRWAANSDRGVIGRGVWKGRETLGVIVDFDLLLDDAAADNSDADYLVAVAVSDPESLLPITVSGLALVRVPAYLKGLQRRVINAQSTQLSARQLFVCLERVIGEAAGIGIGASAIDTAQIALVSGQLAIRSARAATALRASSLDLRLADFYRLPSSATVGVRRQLVEAALDTHGYDTLSTLLARLLDAGLASPYIAALADHDGAIVDIENLAASLSPTVRACFVAAAVKPYGAALPQFDAVFWNALGEVLAHQAHAALQSITDGRINGSANRHRQRLERYRAALACCGDALLLGREPLLDDGASESALTDAYAQTLRLAAALQAHADAGLPRNDEPLLDAYCERCCRRIEEALDGFLNAQRKLRRRIGLQALLLPLGRVTRLPDDAHYAQLAGMLQKPGPVRHRLFDGLPAADVTQTRLLDVLDAAAPAQQRLLQRVDAGDLQTGFPLEQIVEAARLNLIDAAQADALRAAYNVGEDWRLRS